MIHGSTDATVTWCAEMIAPSSLRPMLEWSLQVLDVMCVPCLRAAALQGCGKCRDRKRAAKEAK